MDGAAWAADLFGGLPYFNPGMQINLSGLCATTKLIQCRDFGVYQCDVTRKFQKHPDEIVDLQKLDFLGRRKIVKTVEKWVSEKQSGGRRVVDEWLPILYDYEIVRGSAKRLKDRGHLIFTDMTTTRFLLVMCFGDSVSSCHHNMSFEEDYAAITKANANQFFSLLKYLYYDENQPKFVRATYTTIEKGLHPQFLNSVDKPSSAANIPIFHVTEENFAPSLQQGEVERIDNTLTQFQYKIPPVELKRIVMGDKSSRPEVGTWTLGNVKDPNVCAHCGKQDQKAMPMCSNCKLVRYCSKDCQKSAWSRHKKVCKTPPTQATAA